MSEQDQSNEQQKLVLTNVSKAFGHNKVLNDLDLSVPAGKSELSRRQMLVPAGFSHTEPSWPVSTLFEQETGT